METGFSAANVDRTRKKTILLVLLADILLILFTLHKGHPTIWNEFDREFNAWTFGKATQMIFTALVAYSNYLLVSLGSSPAQRKRAAWPWAFLAFAFVFMAFDDMLILHERGGHAIENAIPLLSRHHIYVYMDDLLEFAYAAAAMLYGLLFMRRLMPDRKALRYYMYGVSALAVATCIGLSPAIKGQPFPMALIQFLHIGSVYMFFVSFTRCTAAEVRSAISSIESTPGGKSPHKTRARTSG